MKSQKCNGLEYRYFKDYEIMLISLCPNNNPICLTKVLKFNFYKSLNMFMDKDFIIFDVFKNKI